MINTGLIKGGDYMWQNIIYEDGSNPYICKTEAELLKLKKKYGNRMVQLSETSWLVKKGE